MLLRFVIMFTMLDLGLAQAREQIDRSIDEAAGRIVAQRMGDLRTGLDAAHVPRPAARVAPASQRPVRPPREPVWIDGLARALERRYHIPDSR